MSAPYSIRSRRRRFSRRGPVAQDTEAPESSGENRSSLRTLERQIQEQELQQLVQECEEAGPSAVTAMIPAPPGPPVALPPLVPSTSAAVGMPHPEVVILGHSFISRAKVAAGRQKEFDFSGVEFFGIGGASLPRLLDEVHKWLTSGDRRLRAKIVIVHVSDNDLDLEAGPDPDVLAAQLIKLVRHFVASGVVQVFVIPPYPRAGDRKFQHPQYDERRAVFRNRVLALIVAEGLDKRVSLYKRPSFKGHNVLGITASDGVHLNERGLHYYLSMLMHMIKLRRKMLPC